MKHCCELELISTGVTLVIIKPLNPPIIKKFNCSVCNKEAGTITLTFTSPGSGFIVNCFLGAISAGLAPDKVTSFKKALEEENVPALFALDLESTPFYCPKCDACYCNEHWSYWLVFDDELTYMIDSTRGRCPKGHERMLLD